MKNYFYHIACLFLLFSLLGVSCTKLELPDEVDKDKTDKDDTPTSPSQPDDTDVYSIASLQEVEEGESVLLKGYIVGYVPTSSINKMRFSVEDAVPSNIVLADSPQEKDPSNCAAIQLKKDKDARDDLNLQDNPEMLGKCVLVYGDVATYMGSKGLKDVESYELVETGGDDNPSSPSEPSSSIAFPTLSDDAPIVFEGD